LLVDAESSGLLVVSAVDDEIGPALAITEIKQAEQKTEKFLIA
jgi:hypothetical protein